jgi:hypothetical protein
MGLVQRSKIEILSAATASDIKAGAHVLLVLEKGAAGSTTTGAARERAQGQ